MATQMVEYLDKRGAAQLAAASKAYSLKVSALTIDVTNQTDGSQKIHFVQNGTAVCDDIVISGEKFLKSATIVEAPGEPEPGDTDKRIPNPDYDNSLPVSEDNPEYLPQGTYIEYIVEGLAPDGGDKKLYVPANTALSNFEPITTPTITDWFKDESTLTLNDNVVVTTVNGEAPEADQTYYTGDELVLTAPLDSNSDGTGDPLIAITVNGTAITTDTSAGTASYQISDYDYEVTIGANYSA